MPFLFTYQLDAMDCIPACLKMITDHHGRAVSLQKLREKCHISREGISLAGISESTESLGLRTMAAKVTHESQRDLPGLKKFPLPRIAHWEQRHIVGFYSRK